MVKINIDIESGHESVREQFDSVSDALGWLETVGMDKSFTWGAEEIKKHEGNKVPIVEVE